MTWSYDSTDLDTTTASGRLNTVRLMIGDTDTNDQLVQDEEITFALTTENNDVYLASSLSCRFIAAKYSRLVDTQIDRFLKENYSDLSKQYYLLSTKLEDLGKKNKGTSLGVFAGGISKTAIDSVRTLPDRNPSSFRVGKFDNIYADPNAYSGYNNV